MTSTDLCIARLYNIQHSMETSYIKKSRSPMPEKGWHSDLLQRVYHSFIHTISLSMFNKYQSGFLQFYSFTILLKCCVKFTIKFK